MADEDQQQPEQPPEETQAEAAGDATDEEDKDVRKDASGRVLHDWEVDPADKNSDSDED